MSPPGVSTLIQPNPRPAEVVCVAPLLSWRRERDRGPLTCPACCARAPPCAQQVSCRACCPHAARCWCTVPYCACRCPLQVVSVRLFPDRDKSPDQSLGLWCVISCRVRCCLVYCAVVAVAQCRPKRTLNDAACLFAPPRLLTRPFVVVHCPPGAAKYGAVGAVALLCGARRQRIGDIARRVRMLSRDR